MQPDSEPQVPATIIGPAISGVARQGLAWLEAPSGERRYVQSELRIGRGEQNDLRLTDASVSRYHAFLRRVDGRYLLSDVGSQNGTFVNGRQVHAPSALESGDRIRAGTTELTFHKDVPADSSSNADEPSTTIVTGANTAVGAHMQEYVQGDLRIVTVLFLDLHGFTAMSETMPPDEVTHMMNRCFERLTATVARFGGYVDKYVGDAMMVLFGAPVAHADDPERAVRAALALQEELARFNQQQRKSNINLQMRIGINTGEVLAGRVGAAQFGQYTVMGDAVNLASRLEHAARVGHVLVGETTHRFTSHIIRYAALPPLAIKGKAEPVQTYEVVGIHSPTTSAGVAMDSSFVGRKLELTLLGDLIKSSSSGFQSATVVAGPSAGKSSLLMELYRRHVGDARWAVARCSEYDRGTPYLVLRYLTMQILRSTGRAADVLRRSPSDTASAQLAALAQLLSPNVEPTSAGSPEGSRQALASAFTHLLTEHAVRECLVLIIDGIQWIDSESLAVLDAVVPDLEDARVVLITSARPEWRHTWPNEVLSLRLERFSREECAQFVSYLLRSSTVAPDSLETLARESDGNPLLLAEMVRSGVESGGLCEMEGEWRLVRRAAASGGGVDSLRSIVQARLDQLSADERRVMQVGAVLGQNWTATLLARVMEENLPVQDLLRELAEREYLIQEMGGEEPAYSFSHSITQEVAYASLPHTVRERLHDRVGRVLEDQFDPVRPNKVILRHLVHHFMSGSSPDRAAQYLLYAADAGAGIADDTWAMETCRRALDYAQKVRDRNRRRTLVFEVQERMGDALLRQSNLAEAQVAYEAAGDLDETTERGCRLRLKLAHVASRQGNHVRVVGLARSGVEGADLDPQTRAALEARTALSLCSMGQLREADERVTRAMSLVEGVHEGPALDLVVAASAALLRLRGDLAQARELIEDRDPTQVQAIGSEGANDLRVELGQTFFALGDIDAALRIAEETPERDSWIYVTSEVLLGRASLERGLVEQARSYLDDAFVRAQRIGAREEVLAARLYVAHAALAARRPTEAAEVAHAVAASADALKLRPMVYEAHAVLSAALVQTNDFARAVEIAREAVVRGRTLRLPIHEAVCRRALGLALVHAGDTANGRKHLEAAAGVFEQLGARTELNRTLQAISDLSARLRS